MTTKTIPTTFVNSSGKRAMIGGKPAELGLSVSVFDREYKVIGARPMGVGFRIFAERVEDGYRAEFRPSELTLVEAQAAADAGLKAAGAVEVKAKQDDAIEAGKQEEAVEAAPVKKPANAKTAGKRDVGDALAVYLRGATDYDTLGAKVRGMALPPEIEDDYLATIAAYKAEGRQYGLIKMNITIRARALIKKGAKLNLA